MIKNISFIFSYFVRHQFHKWFPCGVPEELLLKFDIDLQKIEEITEERNLYFRMSAILSSVFFLYYMTTRFSLYTNSSVTIKMDGHKKNLH